MTGDSCYTVRRAGSVTPGSCQSRRSPENTSLPDIAGAAAKHAASGVMHPHMSTGSL